VQVRTIFFVVRSRMIRQLRQKCVTLSAPLKSANGQLLSDRESVVARWQEYFSTLLNQSSLPPQDVLFFRSQSKRASTQDPLIDTSSPIVMETYKAMNRMKVGKAPDHVATIQNTSGMVKAMQCMHCTRSLFGSGRMKLLQRNGTKV